MNTILLEQNNSTFINNIELDNNYSSLDYATVSNYNIDNINSYCITFIDFNFDLFEASDIIIHSAHLILPLHLYEIDSIDSSKELVINYNTEDFCYETITWRTMPASDVYSTTNITRTEIEQKFIAVDMTEFVYNCVYSCLNNYGINISVTTSDFMMVLPKNQLQYSPKMLIQYTKRSCKRITPPTLSANCTDKQAVQIVSDDNIIMNEIEAIDYDTAYYDTETGIITILKKGYYNFYFELNIDGSSTSECTCSEENYINIAIKNLTTNIVYNFYAPEILPAKIHSQTAIYIDNDSEQLVLINNSTKILQLANYPIQASIKLSPI